MVGKVKSPYGTLSVDNTLREDLPSHQLVLKRERL